MTTVSTPPLPLQVRKALLSRIFLYEATDPNLFSLETEFPGHLSDLFHSADSITILELESPHNDVHLDDYLCLLVAQLKSRLLAPSPDDVRQAFLPVFSRLDQRINAFCCSTCNPSHICNGTWGDNEAISSGGKCIAYFTEAFEYIVNLTKDIHRTIGISLKDRCNPVVEFSTEYEKEKMRPFGSEYQVNGRTDFLDDKHPISRVSIRVCPSHFNWETYLAIVYVLFHEMVCHVFQGKCGNTRKSPSPGDSFAEGWMDYIAKEIMVHLAYGWTPGKHLAGCYTDDRHLSIADDFHRKKHTRKDRFTRRTALGAEAARRMRILLDALPNQETWHDMLKLSLDINTSPISHEKRQLFTSSINALLPPTRTSLPLNPYNKASMALYDAMERYRITDDVGGFVDDVLSIPIKKV